VVLLVARMSVAAASLGSLRAAKADRPFASARDSEEALTALVSVAAA